MLHFAGFTKLFKTARRETILETVMPIFIGKQDCLIVQNEVEKRAVYLQSPVVVNEAQFPEPVHEKTHSRAGCPDHFRQGFLANLGNHGLRNRLLAKMRSVRGVFAGAQYPL